MKSTAVFEQILQVDRSSVADEALERMAPLIFEKEETKCRIEVRCLTASDLTQFRRIAIKRDASSTTKSLVVGTSSPEIAQVGPESDKVQRSVQLHTIDIDLTKLRSLIQVYRTRNLQFALTLSRRPRHISGCCELVRLIHNLYTH